MVGNSTTGVTDNTWCSWTTASLNNVTSSSTTGNNDAWASWAQGTTGTTTTKDNSTTVVWTTWVTSDGASSYVAAQPRLTEDVRAAREAEAQKRRAENAEIERKKAEADRRAEDLLRVNLTREQRHTLEAQSEFLVRSELDRLYRIKRGRVQNVEELDADGKVFAQWCVHPREQVPNADTMLAQKLLLETSEEEFRHLANRRGMRH